MKFCLKVETFKVVPLDLSLESWCYVGSRNKRCLATIGLQEFDIASSEAFQYHCAPLFVIFSVRDATSSYLEVVVSYSF